MLFLPVSNSCHLPGPFHCFIASSATSCDIVSPHFVDLRGLDTVPRGWSVSMFTGNKWQDLAGCDFVLDLLGEMEDVNCPSQSSSNYPIIPERDVSYSQKNSPNR